MTRPRVQLKVENFGPIVEGTVEFKPLTFLIGPNNSGKTYIATLLYALTRVLRAGLFYPFAPPAPGTTADLAQFMNGRPTERNGSLRVSELPEALSKAIFEYLDRQQNFAPTALEESLRSYFSVPNLASLTRADPESGARLRIAATGASADSILPITISVSETTVDIQVPAPFPDSFEAPPGELLAEMGSAPDLVPLTLAMYLWYKRAERYGFRHRRAFYLPAVRSGIMDSWPLLSSLAVRLVSSRLGRQPIDIPPLPGVAGDFLQLIIERFMRPTGRNGRDANSDALQSVLDVLEDQLLGGRVVIDEVQPGVTSILYESELLRIPLQRASSMVVELAPLDLWIRELVNPDDLLIIDEPESHLHPENQRLIARALVRLVNAGVDVVAPTHSSTILHQVSNMLIASTLDKESRTRLGFSEADFISVDDIAVYLFEQRADGTHIVQVEVDSGFGISEDEFVRVAEAIGDETFNLSLAAAHQPA